MTSVKDIYLIPPASVHARWESATEEQLLEGIHGVDRYIRDHAHQKSYQLRQGGHSWYVSPTLNGAVSEKYIINCSCIRAELIFLCITHACAVFWSVHSGLVKRGSTVTRSQIKPSFRKLRRAYVALRDVAKRELALWTLRPEIPEVAEFNVETVDFLLALCAALHGLCVCLFSTCEGRKMDHEQWAQMTLFVAERFETAYSILYKCVWPMYGCQHESAIEVTRVLSGYALYYRSKCYATLLHDDTFVNRCTSRQLIALARCTEYLILPLTDPMFGFSGDRITRYLEDMRDMVRRYLPICEEPVVGVARLETGDEYEKMFSIVNGEIPDSLNLLESILQSKHDRPYFVNDPHFGNYNVGEQKVQTHQSGVRKPRFILDLDE